jgi:DNA recombination protein RmuC
MNHMSIVLAAAVGILLGGAVTWSFAAGRLGKARARAARLAAELEASRRDAARQEQAEERLTNAFAAMSREALDRNSQTFLDLAGTRLAEQQAVARGELDQRRQAVDDLVGPLRDALQRVESSIAGVERARQEAYTGLTAQVRGLAETHERLRAETSHLAGALRSSQTRGRWGEVQLRRVVELAGMVPHCDFVEQVTVERAGTVRRPDVIVRLPGDRHIAVDAKVPLAAYLQAHETDNDDERRMLLRDHARQLRTHVNGLADKAYWEQFPHSPDLVVLFLPGEPFLAAAYEHDPDLFEHAHARRVLIATPTTLIALLQSIAFGWRQESMAANARAVCEIGQELYKRLATMGEHVAAVGKSLDKAVEAYNRQVGSLETRVLVTARRLADLDVSDGELTGPEPVERAARALQSAELTRFSSVTDDEVA